MNESMLDFYKRDSFNPVDISIGNDAEFRDHAAKRRNLYERNLHIPLGLLRRQSVLEFGCNSGENALVLAKFGARLTLVEPNDQVIKRLFDLFGRFSLEGQIDAVQTSTVQKFTSERRFDLVLAEGFLHALPDRRAALEHILSFVAPAGLCVITDHPSAGNVIEWLKRSILARACVFENVGFDSEESLGLARRLFEEDFDQIPHSRPFSNFWKDGLIAPYWNSSTSWGFSSIMEVATGKGFRFYSSSPEYRDRRRITWYKNVESVEEDHLNVGQEYLRRLPAFVFGKSLFENSELSDSSADGIAHALDQMVRGFESYVRDPEIDWPDLVSISQLGEIAESELHSDSAVLATEFDGVICAARDASSTDDLITAYKAAHRLRNVWGTPLHYIAFVNEESPC